MESKVWLPGFFPFWDDLDVPEAGEGDEDGEEEGDEDGDILTVERIGRLGCKWLVEGEGKGKKCVSCTVGALKLMAEIKIT